MHNSWALSPASLQWIASKIKQYDCCRILECGSGASTEMLAQQAAANNSFSSISLEHQDEYYGQIIHLAQEPGVDIWLRHLAKTRYGDWYNLSAYDHDRLAARKIDMLLIDGPPQPMCRFRTIRQPGSRDSMLLVDSLTPALSRYPAVPILLPYCRPGTIVILDDAHRPAEQQTIELWTKEWGLTLIDQSPIGKGMALLQFNE